MVSDYKKSILKNLDHPAELERLYREDPEKFKRAFPLIFEANKNLTILQVWHARLSFDIENDEKLEPNVKWNDLLLLIAISLVAGTIARFLFSPIENGSINPANIGFSVFPLLSFYFIIKNRPTKKLILIISLSYFLALIYLNFLPVANNSDSIILANLHLPFLLWSLVLISFTGNYGLQPRKVAEFLRYNGELIISVGILLICGIVLTAFTMGLFKAIQISIEEFYVKNILVFGIAVSPFIGTYLTKVKGVTKNFAPTLAKIFSPLVLLTLIGYLFAIIVTQKNPYTDRDFLLIFNLMLILVLAITVFSVAGRYPATKIVFNDRILFALLIVAIVIDSIALSAILFRLTSYGITPNRMAVLGMNLIVLVNLVKITIDSFKFLLGKVSIAVIEASITKYLPIYSLWALFVTVGFPIIFNFE